MAANNKGRAKTPGKFLTAADILSAPDMEVRDVAVPEWGGVVRISTMTAQARDRFELQSLPAAQGGDTDANFRARLIAACAVDEDGGLLFTADQVAALGAKSARAADRLYAVAARLNGLTAEDEKALSENPTGGSSSGSA